MNWKRMPKQVLRVLALSTVCLQYLGCSPSAPVVAEYMTVSPQTLTYPNPDTTHSVALTHSCSCPVTYLVTPLDPSATWLEVGPQTIVGDNGAFPVRINRSNLTADTSRARLQISSNAYKTLSGNTFDTLTVIAYR